MKRKRIQVLALFLISSLAVDPVTSACLAHPFALSSPRLAPQIRFDQEAIPGAAVAARFLQNFNRQITVQIILAAGALWVAHHFQVSGMGHGLFLILGMTRVPGERSDYEVLYSRWDKLQSIYNALPENDPTRIEWTELLRPLARGKPLNPGNGHGDIPVFIRDFNAELNKPTHSESIRLSFRQLLQKMISPSSPEAPVEPAAVPAASPQLKAAPAARPSQLTPLEKLEGILPIEKRVYERAQSKKMHQWAQILQSLQKHTALAPKLNSSRWDHWIYTTRMAIDTSLNHILEAEAGTARKSGFMPHLRSIHDAFNNFPKERFRELPGLLHKAIDVRLKLADQILAEREQAGSNQADAIGGSGTKLLSVLGVLALTLDNHWVLPLAASSIAAILLSRPFKRLASADETFRQLVQSAA